MRRIGRCRLARLQHERPPRQITHSTCRNAVENRLERLTIRRPDELVRIEEQHEVSEERRLAALQQPRHPLGLRVGEHAAVADHHATELARAIERDPARFID